MLALAVVAGCGAAGTASACEPVYQKVVCFQTVICYETKKVPYLRALTAYDHCGKPYPTYEVCYKEVKVAVTRKVPVVKYVLVCE